MTAKTQISILIVEIKQIYILSTTHTNFTVSDSRFDGTAESAVADKFSFSHLFVSNTSGIDSDLDIIGLSILSVLLINILILILS